MTRLSWFSALGIWMVLAGLALAQPYKALIVTGQNGHKWELTTPELKKLVEQTGLFTCDVALSPPKGQDMSGFKPNFAAYQVVIIDAPPVLAVTDPTIMGSKVGTVLLVARFGRHAIDELSACQKILDHAGVRLLGCVFNDVQTTVLASSGSKYQYAYHYSYKA